jgi:hypothetical protein
VYRPTGGISRFVLSASGNPETAKATIAQSVRDFDASLELRDLRTFGEVIDDSLVRERLVSRLSAVFAVIALIMAAMGICGTVAYSVSQRTREIGIRMALGARARTIVSMLARDTALTVGAGVAAGGAGAVMASRGLASLLFGVTPADPLILTLAVLTLVATASPAGFRRSGRHRSTRRTCCERSDTGGAPYEFRLALIDDRGHFRLGGLLAGRQEVRVLGLDWRAAPPPSSCRVPSPHRVACLSTASAFLSLASVHRHLRILPAMSLDMTLAADSRRDSCRSTETYSSISQSCGCRSGSRSGSPGR